MIKKAAYELGIQKSLSSSKRLINIDTWLSKIDVQMKIEKKCLYHKL